MENKGFVESLVIVASKSGQFGENGHRELRNRSLRHPSDYACNRNPPDKRSFVHPISIANGILVFYLFSQCPNGSNDQPFLCENGNSLKSLYYPVCSFTLSSPRQ